MVADEAGHGQLVVERVDLDVGLVGVGHVHAGGGFDVRDEVAALERGDVAVDVPQLMLDDIEALIDELGGADGNLVLVFHPVLVVDGDDGVEDVLSTLRIDIVIGEVDDRRLLFV